MSEVRIDDAWSCPMRSRNTLYISSNSTYFIKEMFLKAAVARNRIHTIVPWIPLVAMELKNELQRRMSRIRKIQLGLRTKI